ncbi:MULTISPECIES: helix-turn-helix domain-containing protein [unclassified Legionella]|uniref:helix-turn-helix domain-containing protein n=1 Tax=unclassified Legionella TaxID=2622702 RepID=UPI001054D8F0|nr:MULTISPECIES: helix-turn-helix transcriptional regulator [unclassified Legionella]MDI9819925.1 helix-turn-helix transcriptional regulator [Legionella sp. PL877]
MVDSPLPKRLKEARKIVGLSQRKLGVATGMDEFSAGPRVNQYETGKHTPDFLTLKRIADVLFVPTAYFYAEEDNLAEIIRLLGRLNPEQRMTFCDAILKKISNEI